jgi:hypothetical protein
MVSRHGEQVRNIQRLLKGEIRDWYEVERNTATLLDAVAGALELEKLSGNQIWQLMRLTWITNNVHGVSPNHWQTLKVPALGSLFGKGVEISGDHSATIRAMGLPFDVELAAIRNTGVVNFRYVWRNTAQSWCVANRRSLLEIIRDARRPAMSLDDRIELAARIEGLPSIPSPDNKASVRSALALAPLIAFLDPQHRFPIISGGSEVARLLKKLKLTNSGFGDQVRHLTGLIGQFGIEDVFMLDVLAKDIATLVTATPPDVPGEPRKSVHQSETQLPEYDLDERLATQHANTIVYRNRHNEMTEALKSLFAGHELVTSYDHDRNYDVLVRDYDRKSRDLLIEAKPDADRGSIRIAIGQLLDYRRFLKRSAASDLAVLTILPPSPSYIELLEELQITALWYTDETCQKIGGAGRAWPVIKNLVHVSAAAGDLRVPAPPNSRS